MNPLGLRPILMYRSTLQETIKFLRTSPALALLCIGAIALLTGGLLMLLFVAILR